MNKYFYFNDAKISTFQYIESWYNRKRIYSRAGFMTPQKSFFGHMKSEINLKVCITFDSLKSTIDHYMDYYNNYRYQWGLKKLAPIQYLNQLLAA